MKRWLASLVIAITTALCACLSPAKHSTPAASIAPAGSAKMTPDQPVSETAAAGKDAEIASTKPAATAVAEDGFDPTAVVSETVADGGTVSHFAPAEPATASAPAGLTISQQMLAACNRLTPNCQRVESPALSIAAQRYADYLARTHQQGHYANGSPEQRAAAAGFTGTLLTPGRRGADGWTHYGIGEVLSFGAQDIGGAFNGWLQSPGHRAALMESSYDVAGFGQSGTVHVGLFGRSTKEAAPTRAASNQIFTVQPQLFTHGSTSMVGTGASVPQSCVGGQCNQRRRLFRW